MKNTTKINLFSTPVVIENDIYRLDDIEMNFLKSLPLRKINYNSISQSSFILENTEMSKISMIIDYYVENYVSGHFYFECYDNSGLHVKTVSEGVFYRVPFNTED